MERTIWTELDQLREIEIGKVFPEALYRYLDNGHSARFSWSKISVKGLTLPNSGKAWTRLYRDTNISLEGLAHIVHTREYWEHKRCSTPRETERVHVTIYVIAPE
jgi:hypothetical protein